MLRKLIELLPVSRRTYNKALEKITESFKETTKTLAAMTIVLEGFEEADANHCQIEMSIMQQLQKSELRKSTPASTTKNGSDPAFM